MGFIGWAGPRGLASIVYAVLIAETPGVPGAREVFLVAGWTILLSVYLHGATASAVSERYGASMRGTDRGRPEHGDVTPLPVRLAGRRHPDGEGEGAPAHAGASRGDPGGP